MVRVLRGTIRASAAAAVALMLVLTAGCLSSVSGRINGTIIDSFTRELIEAPATVRVGSRQVTTSSGSFALSRVPTGPREIAVEAAGYLPASTTVTVVSDKTTTVVVALTKRPPDGLSSVVGRATLMNDPSTYPGAAGAAGKMAAAPSPARTPLSPSPAPAAATAEALQVRPSPGVSDDAFRAVLESRGYTIDSYLPLTGVYVVRPPVSKARTMALSAEQLSVELSTLEQVEFVYPDYPVWATALQPNDPVYAAAQWHYRAISLPRAWAVETGATRRVTVAVIDTGLRFEHPDLGPNALQGWDFVDNDDNPTDVPFVSGNMKGRSHGTHVAGTIAAVTNNGAGVAGVNWAAEILPVRVLDGNGSGSYSRIAEAIIWSVDHGADVINMSLSGNNEPGPVLRSAVQYALARGVAIVAAAGNSANYTGTDPEYPAALPGVISVSAVGGNNEPAYYSNYGPDVAVAAPGGSMFNNQIISTGYNVAYPNVFDSYLLMQGTSMAAPHVTGVVSLLLAARGSMPPAEIAALLRDTSHDLGDEGRDDVYGSGLVNAYAALVEATMDKAIFWVLTKDGHPASSGAFGLRDRGFRIEDAQPGEGQLVGWLDVDDNGLIDEGDFFGIEPLTVTPSIPVVTPELLELAPVDSMATSEVARTMEALAAQLRAGGDGRAQAR